MMVRNRVVSHKVKGIKDSSKTVIKCQDRHANSHQNQPNFE